jgi:hypothetical protein
MVARLPRTTRPDETDSPLRSDRARVVNHPCAQTPSLPMLLRVILAPSHNRVSGVFALLFQEANPASKWEKVEIEFVG